MSSRTSSSSRASSEEDTLSQAPDTGGSDVEKSDEESDSSKEDLYDGKVNDGGSSASERSSHSSDEEERASVSDEGDKDAAALNTSRSDVIHDESSHRHHGDDKGADEGGEDSSRDSSAKNDDTEGIEDKFGSRRGHSDTGISRAKERGLKCVPSAKRRRGHAMRTGGPSSESGGDEDHDDSSGEVARQRVGHNPGDRDTSAGEGDHENRRPHEQDELPPDDEAVDDGDGGGKFLTARSSRDSMDKSSIDSSGIYDTHSGVLLASKEDSADGTRLDNPDVLQAEEIERNVPHRQVNARPASEDKDRRDEAARTIQATMREHQGRERKYTTGEHRRSIFYDEPDLKKSGAKEAMSGTSTCGGLDGYTEDRSWDLKCLNQERERSSGINLENSTFKSNDLGKDEAARRIQGLVRSRGGRRHSAARRIQNQARSRIDGRKEAAARIKRETRHGNDRRNKAATRIQKEVRVQRSKRGTEMLEERRLIGSSTQVGPARVRSTSSVHEEMSTDHAVKRDAAVRIQGQVRRKLGVRRREIGQDDREGGFSDQLVQRRNVAGRNCQDGSTVLHAARYTPGSRNGEHPKKNDLNDDYDSAGGRIAPEQHEVVMGSMPTGASKGSPSEILPQWISPEENSKPAKIISSTAAEDYRSPSHGHHQQSPGGPAWLSPGKMVAAAATAAARAAAKSAAAAVRAAEEAADAAEAAEAAVEAEDERQEELAASSTSPGGMFRSPPAREGGGKGSGGVRCSPTRSAFASREDDTDREERPHSQTCGKSAPQSNVQPRGGESSGVEGQNNDNLRSGGALDNGGGMDGQTKRGETHHHEGEDAKLKRAREQARRHARDRRVRAMAKEEDSRRELRAVQADLAQAEETREKQAMAERLALEAKRARVLEDMRRRQQRLQRLQQEESRVEPHPPSPNASSSADTRTERELRQDGGTHAMEGGMTDLSLPPLGGGEHGGEGRARRRHRHVSAFREMVLEERREKKKVAISKRKELEERYGRQANYAAKIRAQAKRMLAAEQRRAQEDVDRSARGVRGCNADSDGRRFVDRTPIVIKKPKRDGEWGVYSYAPDRPPRDRPAGGGGETSGSHGVGGRGGRLRQRHVAGGFGSSDVAHQRLSTSELMDLMRKERARATDASRARAAAAAAGRGSNYDDGQKLNDYKANFTAAEARQETEARSDIRGDWWGSPPRNSRTPPPPVRRRVEERGGGEQSNKDDHHGTDFGDAPAWRGEGRVRLRARPYQEAGRTSGPHSPGLQQRPPAGKDVHAMYEERLAALERRLLAQRGDNEALARGDIAAQDLGKALKSGTGDVRLQSRRPPRPSDEWGPHNNPFERGSASSADVEGLSSIYMGPISNKMAVLRAANK